MTASTIDPRFIDVVFPEVRDKYTFGWDAEELLRDVPSTLINLEDAVDIISESKWKEEIARIEAEKSGIEYLVSRIYNQASEGSCVANACSQAHEVVQARQFGKDKVTHLSAISLYQFIGRSPNSGAMISDGLDVGSEKGIVPLDNETNRKLFGERVMPNTGFRTKRPTGWEAIAKQFRFNERYICKSKAEMITAGILGYPVVVGRAGHSICYLRPTYQNGTLLYGYANSWDYDWGSPWGDIADGGFGFDTARNFNSSAQWCFAIRSVVEPDHLAIAL